jgi:uroporphyrinogen decarboxylase
MTPRERVIRTLNHKSIDRVPRDAWLLPGVETERADDLAELNMRFPSDIAHLDARSDSGKRAKQAPSKGKPQTDAWGCTWQLDQKGMPGELAGSPLGDASNLAAYQPPSELLTAARFTRGGRSREGTARFLLAWSDVQPLNRLQWLRGPEAATSELSAGNKELRGLLGRLDEFFCRELNIWGGTESDGIVLGDNLLAHNGHPISVKIWRKDLKPLYRQYCEILHGHDKFVFYHSEAPLGDYFGELVELGIDAIHSPCSPSDFEKLAEKYRGYVTFWGEISREATESSAISQEIRDGVSKVRAALDHGAGGVIAQCQLGPNTPLRNVVAFFEQWLILPADAGGPKQ